MEVRWLRSNVPFLGGKTVLPSFHQFGETLRTDNVRKIQKEKEQTAYVQSFTCSTPKDVNTSDSFHISPLEASCESQHEIHDAKKNTTVIEKFWKRKLVDYDTSKDDDSCLLDLSLKSTNSVTSTSDNIHSIKQTAMSPLCEERKIGTIEFVNDSKESITNMEYCESNVQRTSAQRQIPKTLMHGPYILQKPIDNSEMVQSITDNGEFCQRSFEDTSFTTDDEQTAHIKPVVHMEPKKERGRPRTKCVQARSRHPKSASQASRMTRSRKPLPLEGQKPITGDYAH